MATSRAMSEVAFWISRPNPAAFPTTEVRNARVTRVVEPFLTSACDLQLAENDLPVAVEGEDVESVLVLLELRELVAEYEQWLPDQIRVLDDPLFQRQLVHASGERGAAKGG